MRRITPIPIITQQTNTVTIKISQSAVDFPAYKDEPFIYLNKQHSSLSLYSSRKKPQLFIPAVKHPRILSVVCLSALRRVLACCGVRPDIALECSRVIMEPQALAVVCPLSMSLMHSKICLILTFSSGLASISLCPTALRFYMKEDFDNRWNTHEHLSCRGFCKRKCVSGQTLGLSEFVRQTHC